MGLSSANWILIEASAATLIAPLCGVMLQLAERRLRVRRTIQVFIVLGVAVAGSGAIISSASRLSFVLLVQSQATVVCASIALGALGAYSSSIFADVLDAAGASLALSLVAAAGVFLTGPVAADMPTTLVDWMLLASPIVSAASASGIDLFRSAFLYERSPIAHRMFSYPTWIEACTVYLLLATSLSAAAFVRISARSRSASLDVGRR
jgi:hypothetical protein